MSLTTAARARILIIVGGLLVVLAIILGSQKLEVGDTTCGSAFGASVGAGDASIYGSRVARDCGDQVSERRFIALGVGVLGVAGLLGGGYLQRRETATT